MINKYHILLLNKTKIAPPPCKITYTEEGVNTIHSPRKESVF